MMFFYDDFDEGRVVLNMVVLMGSDGVMVFDMWDVFGMRGMGSYDVELRDVFVFEERVLVRCLYGCFDGVL